jgi:hypothetical protein
MIAEQVSMVDHDNAIIVDEGREPGWMELSASAGRGGAHTHHAGTVHRFSREKPNAMMWDDLDAFASSQLTTTPEQTPLILSDNPISS